MSIDLRLIVERQLNIYLKYWSKQEVESGSYNGRMNENECAIQVNYIERPLFSHTEGLFTLYMSSGNWRWIGKFITL